MTKGCIKGLSFSLRPSRECKVPCGFSFVCGGGGWGVCAHTHLAFKEYSLNAHHVAGTVQCAGDPTVNKEHVGLCPCSLTILHLSFQRGSTVAALSKLSPTLAFEAHSSPE